MAAVTLSPPPDAGEGDPNLTRLKQFAVVRTSGGALRRIGIDPDFSSEVVLAHRELMFGPPVWSANSDTLFLARTKGVALYAFLGDSAPTWRVGSWDGPDVLWTSPNDRMPEAIGNFTISRNRSTIEIQDRTPGGAVFRYRRGLLSRDVHLHQVRVTEHGDRIAILVSRGRGAFTGTPELFVFSSGGSTLTLGGPTGHPRWSADGKKLYAIAPIPGSDKNALYSWSVP